MKQFFAWCIAAALAISLMGCGQEAARRPVEEIPATPQIQTGMIAEQILPGADGDIHYSYFLPESYDGRRTYPLVMVMPGYDMMWFGEDSSGSNLDWNGFLSWTQLDTEMIVVSAQLTDWHEKSARQAIELTEYFLEHYNIDRKKVYLHGFSGGGETGSLVMCKRPELFSAYLMTSSKWDGDLDVLANAHTPVYMAIGEDDSYYGSGYLKQAYSDLYSLYKAQGLSADEISELLVLDVKEQDYFSERGFQDQHGGGMAFAEDESIMSRLFSQ